MTKAEGFKTSLETQHIGAKEDLNAFESPWFQSSGPSNGLYAACMHVCAWNGELLDIIYNLPNVSKGNPCEQQLQGHTLLKEKKVKCIWQQEKLN